MKSDIGSVYFLDPEMHSVLSRRFHVLLTSIKRALHYFTQIFTQPFQCGFAYIKFRFVAWWKNVSKSVSCQGGSGRLLTSILTRSDPLSKHIQRYSRLKPPWKPVVMGYYRCESTERACGWFAALCNQFRVLLFVRPGHGRFYLSC